MYNSRQIQCMQAIGLVPWVRRAAGAEAVPTQARPMPQALPSTRQASADTLQAQTAPLEVEAAALKVAPLIANPPVPTSATDQSTDHFVVCSGDTESALLLIFDNRDGASSWPLSKADDALLDGMLRAIGMSKAAVCSCAMLQDSAIQGQSLQALCQSPRKHFLYFGGEVIAADATDPIAMTQVTPDGVLDGWRLPSLAMLRNVPQRKRQAWITLKLLRSALDHN